jgi:uracil-DNA glycosylase family 4
MATLFDSVEVEQEDVAEVIKSISSACQNCRLSMLHPYNRGFIYRGNPFAELAFVNEAPRESESERGVALVGAHGRAFEQWMKLIDLDTQKDVFITSVIQCMPPKVKKGIEEIQREPEATEISACFGPRCLRVLRAMPNLKAVIALGWVAASALLGTGDTPNDKPKAKTHDAQWFETSYLPGIPVFCMVDPVWVVKKPSMDKNAVVERALDYFKREFLEQNRITELAIEARENREAKGLGLM